jgi:hypothetical protein
MICVCMHGNRVGVETGAFVGGQLKDDCEHCKGAFAQDVRFMLVCNECLPGVNGSLIHMI